MSSAANNAADNAVNNADSALPLLGKTLVLGVGGSISAYKAADLCSKIVQDGATVLPILTKGALQFIQPALFWGLTENPVATETSDMPFGAKEIAHLHYAERADLFVIAPCSANLLARLAVGLCDDMLASALVSNLHKPVLVAPAMNSDMWANGATQTNRKTLESRGYQFIEPGVGRLAEGVVGAGRLAEPSEILEIIKQTLAQTQDLAGLRVLVTAGPTREFLDPVRFISNRSSGKMGYAIARAAARRGAFVTLVSGPVALTPPFGVRETVYVQTAREMEEATLSRADAQDVFVLSAAVADFRPAEVAAQKIKKQNGLPALELIANNDFSVVLGQQKRANQTLIGFAAETESVEQNARKKIADKNLDLIVANDVTQKGAGFDGDTNIVTLIPRNGDAFSLPILPKREVAQKLCDAIKALRQGGAVQ